MALETLSWDTADSLDTPERIALSIEAVLEDGDPALIAAAIGDVARAKGMSQVAQKAGLSREAMYRALSEDGNPRLTTLMAVLKALGLRLTVTPANRTA
ncbi:addiction module antidote protein [Methylobacterium isbiliense]|jgi:probable addiction module antidote protein|uniref:Addiction module antidote protein n=1 Tax=Methylobacterium isbiliense TaxID=315478 RepID=A0ABQ4S9I4_9HYPH|nr:addiction module antidote protein [Methylobacterium isbiliense]MDN3622869.1 putative addiction module antidote protein [Methylobacterium isbiliense]GJD98325.1 hypothetical protein GMJLKIPL_0232 [Methylobacterium isbiliense]